MAHRDDAEDYSHAIRDLANYEVRRGRGGWSLYLRGTDVRVGRLVNGSGLLRTMRVLCEMMSTRTRLGALERDAERQKAKRAARKSEPLVIRTGSEIEAERRAAKGYPPSTYVAPPFIKPEPIDPNAERCE